MKLSPRIQKLADMAKRAERSKAARSRAGVTSTRRRRGTAGLKHSPRDAVYIGTSAAGVQWVAYRGGKTAGQFRAKIEAMRSAFRHLKAGKR